MDRKNSKWILLLLLGVFALNLNAQTGPDPATRESQPFSVPLGGKINLSQTPMDWAATLKNASVIHPPQLTGFKAEWAKEKATANLAKATATPIPSAKTTTAIPPIQGLNFEAQKQNGYPNDNDMAISNGGKIVSVCNSILYVFDQNGGPAQAAVSLSAFGDQGGAGNFTKFDPKAIYDPDHDRFIVVFLSGTRSNTSELVICFSTTNDPTQTWNVYVFNGSTYPLTWSDFPQIGISKEELFVTANQYTDASAYQGSTIWQIRLDEGYTGNTLFARTLQTPYFSLHPVTGGDTLYGPNFFFLGLSTTVPSRTVSLHQMTNTLANNGVLDPPINLQSDLLYNVPPDADQFGSNTILLTNDHRVQSAYFANNRIVWVGNTNFLARPCIYFGTITLSPFNLLFSDAKGLIIQDTDYQFAYPSVTYSGSEGSRTNASVVTFNYSGNTFFPGNGAVFIDGEGNYSPVLELRRGRGYMGLGTETNRRWGDYTGQKRRYSQVGESWFCGSFGNITGGTDSWISQLNVEPSVGLDPTKPTGEITAYPNPTTEWLNVTMKIFEEGTYTLQLFDLAGRMLHAGLSNFLVPGEAEARFNVGHLPSGTYLLSLSNAQGEQVFTQKVSVSH